MLERMPPGEYDVRVEHEGISAGAGGRSGRRSAGLLRGVEVRRRRRRGGCDGCASATHGRASGVENVSSAGLTSVTSAGTAAAGESELDGLPANGEQWESFAELMPAACEDATGNGLVSFSGLPATQNRTTVDGASDDQSFNAVPRGAGGDAGQTTEDEIEGLQQCGGAGAGV